MADGRDERADDSGRTNGDGGAGPPTISLPKGGGAIRGIGEKFGANPVTGTGSLTVPIATSPGRSGFGPGLSLSYSSGAGNGPFGFGWSLSTPSITRKTDKGLPRYRDAEESDVYILSGDEDLVPVLIEDNGEWRRHSEDRSVGGVDYQVQRYRPRIGGLFARIERWTGKQSGAIHWRSISRDNITTIYGSRDDGRIADPEDPLRVFGWLVCESFDDRGNAIYYKYRSEDAAGVDPTHPHERSRLGGAGFAQRYLERVSYGNRSPRRPGEDLGARDDWLFEVVFDYDEGYYEALPADPRGRQRVTASAEPSRDWPVRQDPFSEYRAGFERRSYRLCRRVLIFHRFEDQLGTPAYLVRSTDLGHEESPIGSFVSTVIQSSYLRQGDGSYLKRSMPALELDYTRAEVDETLRSLDPESLENLPVDFSSPSHQWTDLDGEGLSGILSEQAGGWYYKRNLGDGSFAPLERVAAKPALATLGGGRARLMDLAADGRPNVVLLEGPTAGYSERTDDGGWTDFVPFDSELELDWNDPNLRFVDLTGDGLSDVLITEDAVFSWHPSLGERGFGPAERAPVLLDEEQGPRVVFADGTDSIQLGDLSGDGLTDIARIRNGEVCYWPNLGYGRFGARVTMAEPPRFDEPDQFDPGRIRLADIDGSGTTDIIYLGRDGIDLYFNQSGNSWSPSRRLGGVPSTGGVTTVTAVDLLGRGTACLVWSSPLPGDGRAPIRYIDLMAGGKPHLLSGGRNNLGAETRLHYAASTKFYLADRAAGTPWVTKLPFPVHVVERVETHDRVSNNRFVTRYAYHHGFFDGVEREFRGFGMVEQWDTEEFAAFETGGELEDAANLDEASHLPPVLTRTWYHTGASLRGGHISRHFEDDYYREPGLDDDDFEAGLLPDTILPSGLSVEEERQAARALKGSILRQEIYGLDGSDRAEHPYTVSERSHAIRMLQPLGDNRAAVVLVHPSETIEYHYERDPGDPRISHQLTLEVDEYGNVLKAAAVGYGRRPAEVTLSEQRDRETQTATLITYTENELSNEIDETSPDLAVQDDAHRLPMPSESRSYELTGYVASGDGERFVHDDFVTQQGDSPALVFDEEIAYEIEPTNGRQRRLIEQVRTLYRSDDLSGALPRGDLERRALPYQSYRLAFGGDLLERLYGDRVTRAMLVDDGRFVELDGDGRFWIPTGKVFFSPGVGDSPAVELAQAEQHFFRARRFEDVFGESTVVSYDDHDLLLTGNENALGSVVAAENDYRVLQPFRITDANGNRSQVVFDVFGLAAGTALMGKQGAGDGDSLEGFEAEPDQSQIDAFFADPTGPAAAALLADATTRIVYDLTRYARSAGGADPVYAATLARESHAGDPAPAGGSKIRVGFSYSDGFGREIQQKAETAPGPLDPEDAGSAQLDPRWVGSGWTLFNNKGLPVKKFEPFFSPSHDFEPKIHGLSSTLVYDPIGRNVATLHPNHSYEKVVFDPWRQESWDVNDTIHPEHRFDPQTGSLPDLQYRPTEDPDVGGAFTRLPETEYWPTWYARRSDPAERLAAWPDQDENGNPLPHNQQRRGDERRAAEEAARHAATPSVAHLDSLGRTFLTVSDNGRDDNGVDRYYESRVELDIEGNQRAAIDARDRRVMGYDYDMLGNRLVQRSMEAGERRSLSNVVGSLVYVWDSRDHRSRYDYDVLRRRTALFVSTAGGAEILAERTVYGESQVDPEASNLRGRVHQILDGAGVVTHLGYDFKGNSLEISRQLRQDYKTPVDWQQIPVLEPVGFASTMSHDAMNRAIQIVAPHLDQPDARIDVIQPSYDQAGLLRRVDLWLGIQSPPPGLLDPATADLEVVRNIDYDAKGQRTRIEYGSGAVTDYSYDPETFRLIRLTTSRPSFAPGQRIVQDLRHAYDAVGNVASIRDEAQQTVYFDNTVVEPHAEYLYDAIYRLVSSGGREHVGRPVQAAPGWIDAGVVEQGHPHDGSRLRRYTERYDYDEVGNILAVVHQANGGGWTRSFAYDEPSPLQPATTNNRLSETTVGTDTETYSHDAHGNMTRMPQLPVMEWDFEDQLVMTERQVVGNGGTPERTYYVYDAAGSRIRKITERQNGTRKQERIYLGGFEIYREYDGGGSTTLERQSLHVMDEESRVALIETRTAGDDGSPERLVRFQHGNHLGSAVLELDRQGATISYEEYYPYGSTSYQAVDKSIRAAAKRYRFSGKERDEETGLYHHGARYYACWLGRWTAADPAGLADGHNLFAYGHGNPVGMRDPTGTTNVPATGNDRSIMMMTDGQLHRHLKSMSPEARASFARGATGMFATRAWATLNRGGMAIGYKMPAAKITAPRPKPKPVAPSKPVNTGGMSLPNVKHPKAWTPPAIIRKNWENMIDEAANSGNPWYTRVAAGAGAVVGFLPTASEGMIHGIIAAPQLAVTETIAAGEHYARGSLLAEQGSHEAATDEYLAAAQAGSEGTANAATTVAVVGGGVQAVRARAGKTVIGDPAVDPYAPTQPAPPPSKPSAPTPPVEPPPSQPPAAPSLPPARVPPKPPGRGPVGPTETPGPYAPDTPPGKVVPGFDPRNPRIPKPPRPPTFD